MDPFQVLGLAPTATLRDAEDAYHQLLRVHHPDLHHGAAPAAIAAAEERTRRLNHAIGEVRNGYRPARATVSSSSATGSDPDAGGWWNEQDEARWQGWVDGKKVDRPTVLCPSCGLEMHSAAEFTAHMATSHDIKLERRQRRRRRRSTRGSMGLWTLGPLNALVAIGIGAGTQSLVGDTQFATWASLVAMAPTAIRVVNGRN